jgi:hypothetical protein
MCGECYNHAFKPDRSIVDRHVKQEKIDQCRRSSLTDFRYTLRARISVQQHLSTTTVPVMYPDLGPFLWMKCPETGSVFQVSLRGSGGLPGIS